MKESAIRMIAPLFHSRVSAFRILLYANDCQQITAPKQAMTNALKTGTVLKRRLWESDDSPKNLPRYKKISPTAVSVAASPRLKASVKIIP